MSDSCFIAVLRVSLMCALRLIYAFKYFLVTYNTDIEYDRGDRGTVNVVDSFDIIERLCKNNKQRAALFFAIVISRCFVANCVHEHDGGYSGGCDLSWRGKGGATWAAFVSGL